MRYNKQIINPKDIIIRTCVSADVDEIYDVQNRVVDSLQGIEKTFFLPFDREGYQNIIDNPASEGEIYGTFYDNKMIGWICLALSDRMEILKKQIPELTGSCADIDGVIVLPNYRGNNLQKLMIKYLETQARIKGIENLVAEITIGNKYSLNNALDLGYEIKTTYTNDQNIERNILLKKLK